MVETDTPTVVDYIDLSPIKSAIYAVPSQRQLADRLNSITSGVDYLSRLHHQERSDPDARLNSESYDAARLITALALTENTSELEKGLKNSGVDLSPLNKIKPVWLSHHIEVSELRDNLAEAGVDLNSIDYLKKLQHKNISSFTLMDLLLDEKNHFTGSSKLSTKQYTLLTAALALELPHIKAEQQKTQSSVPLHKILTVFAERRALYQVGIDSVRTLPTSGDVLKPGDAVNLSHYKRIAECLNDVGHHTVQSLRDPDDPRHDTARKFCKGLGEYQEGLDKEMVMWRVYSEELGKGESVAGWIRDLKQVYEETGDEWYKQLADHVLEHGSDKFAGRLSETSMLSSRLAEQSVDSEQEQHLAGNIKTISGLDQKQLIPSEFSTEFLASHQIPAQAAILEPKSGNADSWSMQISLAFSSQRKPEPDWITISFADAENTVMVFPDTIDPYSLTPGMKASLVQIGSVLSDEYLREQTSKINTGGIQAVVPSEIRGPAQQQRSESKRQKQASPSDISGIEVTPLKPNEMPGRYRVVLTKESLGLFSEIELDHLNDAVKKYEEGLRVSKYIVSTTDPQGNRYLRIRSGDYRIMGEINNKTGEVVIMDVIKRKNLDEWLKKPKFRT